MRALALAIFGAALVFPSISTAQDLKELVETYVQANQKEILSNLMAALEFPAVAADKANIRRKAEFLRDQLTQRGLLSEVIVPLRMTVS